jgi:membrane protease YdiL (CAAX protease family)
MLSQPWIIPWNFVHIFFLGDPLQKEFDWKGYALPSIQSRYSALVSSVVLGMIWAVWHLPLNLVYWLGPQYEVRVVMFLSTVILFVFASTLLFTSIIIVRLAAYSRR